MKSSHQSFFPKIHRLIPDWPNKQRITWGIRLILVILSLWQIVVLAQAFQAFSKVSANRQETIAQRTLWIDIANKYPGYRDAYFQIAILSYEVGDVATEQKYLQKTILTDPNFAPAQSLEKITETENTN